MGKPKAKRQQQANFNSYPAKGGASTASSQSSNNSVPAAVSAALASTATLDAQRCERLQREKDVLESNLKELRQQLEVETNQKTKWKTLSSQLLSRQTPQVSSNDDVSDDHDLCSMCNDARANCHLRCPRPGCEGVLCCSSCGPRLLQYQTGASAIQCPICRAKLKPEHLVSRATPGKSGPKKRIGDVNGFGEWLEETGDWYGDAECHGSDQDDAAGGFMKMDVDAVPKNANASGSRDRQGSIRDLIDFSECDWVKEGRAKGRKAKTGDAAGFARWLLTHSVKDVASRSSKDHLGRMTWQGLTKEKVRKQAAYFKVGYNKWSVMWSEFKEGRLQLSDYEEHDVQEGSSTDAQKGSNQNDDDFSEVYGKYLKVKRRLDRLPHTWKRSVCSDNESEPSLSPRRKRRFSERMVETGL